MSGIYADAIKRAVSMRDVAEYYGFTIDHRTNKILCPFHDDHNKSLHIYSGDRGYHCFACGAHGDVITFVENYFGLGFIDACKRLNDDFHLGLPIGETISKKQRQAAEERYRRRMEELRRKQDHEKLLWAIYHAALDRYIFLDILKRENAPALPGDDISEEYIYAVKRIDAAWNDVEEAIGNLHKFEEQQRKEHSRVGSEAMNKYAV